MKTIDLNEVVLIPSSVTIRGQAKTIQRLKNENMFLIGSIILSLGIIGLVGYLNYKDNRDERKE
jgi:hypothetical protein